MQIAPLQNGPLEEPGELAARPVQTPVQARVRKGRMNDRTIGLACVVFTALGWGLNWPATKLLLQTCPPLSARGVSGLVAGLVLFGVAAAMGQRLAVPRALWGRLVVASLLNVSAWMGLTTASLVWLPAGQAATLAYTMPVWASLLAWPMLGERLVSRQIGAIVLGLCGVVILIGGTIFDLDAARLPGVGIALSAAVLFAFGTVLSKRLPIPLPRIALTAWQVLLGCIPLLIAGLLFEHAQFDALPVIGWFALGYTAFISMGACYLLWFAALRRLTASSAAIGTLLTPVIGVAASAVALGDPLTLNQVVSLGLVVGGIVLANKA
jgi:drug/metabolite transporter (DMT)-like permease